MHILSYVVPHISLEDLVSKTMVRLTLSAFLGGIIGLEREINRKPAGLRTNMFICFGSAMFTILSTELASEWGIGDHTRIAAQIIPGIGFIGAGSILHSKGSVSGLTTAATLFVVASIGMACGGGLYLPAIFATMLIYLALHVLGILERRFNLKPHLMNYIIVSEKSADDLVSEINSILEDYNKEMHGVRLSRNNGKERVVFSVEGTHSEHKAIAGKFRLSDDLKSFETVQSAELE